MSEQVQIGPYQVLSKLGYGGMAIVYRAIDTRIAEGDSANSRQREVALKILLPQYYNDEAFLRRFAKEGLNARRLKHPNIVQTYAAGHDDGFHYLAMEFVNGGTLEQHISGRGPLSVAETISLLIPIADALDYAHELGYVHRDMKLNNVMRANNGHCFLTDFGVSKHLSTDLSMMTGMGQSIGTPSYMSPEQARGEKVSDGKSDIYSLGVIAYRLLTGQLPFRADDVFELIHKIIFNEPIDPRQLNPQLEPMVANALKQALAKDPADRPATCSAFINALSGIAEPKPASRYSLILGTIAQLLQETVVSPVVNWIDGIRAGRRGRTQGLYGYDANSQGVNFQDAYAHSGFGPAQPALHTHAQTVQPRPLNGPSHRNSNRAVPEQQVGPGKLNSGDLEEQQGQDQKLEDGNQKQTASTTFLARQKQMLQQYEPEPINLEHVHPQRTVDNSEMTQPGFMVPLHEAPSAPTNGATEVTTFDLTVPVTMPVTVPAQSTVMAAPLQLKSTSARPYVPKKFVPGEPLPGVPHQSQPRARQKRTTTVLTQRVKRRRPEMSSAANGTPQANSRSIYSHNSGSDVTGSNVTGSNVTGPVAGHRGRNPSSAAHHPDMDNWFHSSSQQRSQAGRVETGSDGLTTRLYQLFEPVGRIFRRG